MKDREQTSTITVHVPMMFAIRGGRKTIISEVAHAPPQPKIDNALLKALARAHRWRRMIEIGEYASITELAKAEDVNQSYACRLLRLTLLAPVIVTEVLNREHTPDVMLKKLMKPLPVRWDEQLAVLQIHDRAVTRSATAQLRRTNVLGLSAPCTSAAPSGI